MLTYFFRAAFINLYFKTKHSNEMFQIQKTHQFHKFANLKLQEAKVFELMWTQKR